MNFACIFDWDGVIIDSSEHHIEGWRRFAKEENFVFPEHLFKQSFGMKNEQVVPQLWKWTDDPVEVGRIGRKKEAVYRDIMKEKGLVALGGVAELLELLKKNKIPCAIGSSAPMANISTGLDILGYGHYFQTVVSGEDVKLGKPDPQIFLTAAFRLSVLPKHCIVFEDAKVGVAAAHAGGMKVVAVTNTYPAEELSNADLIVSSLEKVTIESLQELHGRSSESLD
jgi:beta-phosphoglucomutase family hydrolase